MMLVFELIDHFLSSLSHVKLMYLLKYSIDRVSSVLIEHFQVDLKYFVFHRKFQWLNEKK